MIHFHSEVPKFSSVQHYIPFKFEDMVVAGTASLLQDIEKKMGVQSRCQPDKLHTPENGSKRQFLSPPDVSGINHGVDWEAEAIVGYEKMPRDKSEYGIHVIGERHTGTSWLYRHLEQCFGDQVKVYDRLSRHKYWFQLDDETKDYGLVVTTSRNVYDWLYAMMEKPLHAPIHYDAPFNKSMTMADFIRTEWAPDYGRWTQLKLLPHDQQLLYAYEHADLFKNVTQGKALHMQPCYDGFTFFDVIPCSFEDRMRTSGIVTVRGDSDDDGDSSAVYEMKKDHPIAEMKP